MNAIRSLFVSVILLSGISLADDPGYRDSIIVETVFADLGDSTVDIRIFATCDDSVARYNIPLAWDPDSGNGIYPVDVSYYYPISNWDVLFDSMLYDDGFIRMIGWADGDPLLVTNNLRINCWTVHFTIDSLAAPQIVMIDTTYDFLNGSLYIVLDGGSIQFAPEFIPGAIYYGVTSDISENCLSVPTNSSLLQNYPNPFNAATTISYSLSEKSEISLSIYNLLGQRVETLFEGVQKPGEHAHLGRLASPLGRLLRAAGDG
jgi:hypothetical protein